MLENVKPKKAPYSSLSDMEKLKKNWIKTRFLYKRQEYSVAIIRAATSMELVVNLIIRHELVAKHKLPDSFVNKLLMSANGIRNKYQNIYLPIMIDSNEYDYLKKLWNTHIDKINLERNKIAHSGEFKTKRTAGNILKLTNEALDQILGVYQLDLLVPFEEE